MAEASPSRAESQPIQQGQTAEDKLDSAWPTVYPRHPAATDADSVVDAADATAWSMPYTDLTMLLMVFFIVMLSIVGPNPSDMADPHDAREGGAPQSASDVTLPNDMDSAETTPALLDRGEGILPESMQLFPSATPTDGDVAEQVLVKADSDPGRTDAVRKEAQKREAHPAGRPGDVQDADFARAWADRVDGLEATALAFLGQSRLSERITLEKTDTGIELRLPSHLLFESGSAHLQANGMTLLSQIAPLLTVIDGDVQVSGHTDNVPIQTARFPSNWELSAGRAIAVVRLLGQTGVPTTKMQAVGHGANRPVASNTHSAGRAANRRVTIDITPRPTRAERAP